MVRRLLICHCTDATVKSSDILDGILRMGERDPLLVPDT
jgi:hypothetical protein